ncbi:MAG TPA: hypothetical protein VMV43_06045 [Candidatus Nanopelagicaceae bacterium]|nr:hypothetical protein [Candidatus Nanopelagicaceae bacterium]
MRRKSFFLIFIGFLSVMIVFSAIQDDFSYNYQHHFSVEDPQLSRTLEGADNLLVVEMVRNTNLSSYGLVNIKDRLTILNNNNNPINSILFGLKVEDSNNLIYFNAFGETQNTLLIERSHEIMDIYEMITIYFDMPLLPSQEITFTVLHSYTNLMSYQLAFIEEDITQLLVFKGSLFPLLPYKSEGNIKSNYLLPEGSALYYHTQIGPMGTPIGETNVLYDLEYSEDYNYLEPFLLNLDENNETTISVIDRYTSKLEIEKIDKYIYISPWGIIKNVEEITIENVGIVEVAQLSMKIPIDAMNVKVYDDLGEVLGVSLIESIDDVSTKIVSIELYQNRVPLTPASKFKFFLEYYLPPEKYISYNWLQQSFSINLLTTKYEYLIHEQTTSVIIEGCGSVDYMSSLPEALQNSGNSKVLVYSTENISPLVKKDVLLTFTIDLFEILLRPIVFVMIIALLSSIFVLAIKTLKREEQVSIFKKEFIPTSEIREFCSLYEERNALVLEIRKAESETKHKKLAKKTYKNLLSKNTAKIDQIKEEIHPFKKILMETNDIFNNIVKRLDVLDAERISISDSLNLLESRYKRGKLPSKAAYQKLSDDFFNRRKKLDRTIDKYIQQLRSYLL